MILAWIIEDPTAGILSEWEDERPHFSWSRPRNDPNVYIFHSIDRAIEKHKRLVRIKRYQFAFIRSINLSRG